MNKKRIFEAILGAVLLVGGVIGCGTTTQAPAATTETPAQATQAEAQTTGKLTIASGIYEGAIKDGLPHGQGSIVYNNGDKFVGSFVNGWEVKGTFTDKGQSTVQEVEYPTPTVPKDINDAGHRVPEPTNDGLYHVDTKRPAGIVIHDITYHEGFRAPGMKAVDVHIMARSNNKENELIQGRDEIVSITANSGKVYDMKGTKRTAVNTNADYPNYQEQEITQYQDIRIDEKIVSIVVRRDGKLITIKPDNETKYDTTHA